MSRVWILVAAFAAMFVLGLAGGRNWLTPAALWAGFNDPADFVFWVLRLPRVLVAAGAGIALGLAGALMQGLTRNPLATPDVIGLTQGAGLGYALSLVAGTALLPGTLAGALAAMLTVLLLTRSHGPLAFVLFGIATGASAAAATTIVLIFASDAKASAAMVWLSGSLERADLADAAVLWAVLGLVLAVAALWGRHLPLLWLGDDVMLALGAGLTRTRRLVLCLVLLLTAAATLAIGPIGFLAFIAAPLARALTGAEPPSLMPAALMGGCLLLVADLAVRLASPLVLVPAGVATSLIGAPYLAFFLMRERRLAAQ